MKHRRIRQAAFLALFAAMPHVSHAQGDEPLTGIPGLASDLSNALKYTLFFLVVLGILTVGYLIARVFANLCKHSFDLCLADTNFPLITSFFVYLSIMLFTVWVVLHQFNLTLHQTLLAFGVIGLIASDVFSPVCGNFISGFILMMDSQIRRNQRVRYLQENVEGTVVSVGFMTTTIVTPKKDLVMIPNRTLTQNVVIILRNRQE